MEKTRGPVVADEEGNADHTELDPRPVFGPSGHTGVRDLPSGPLPRLRRDLITRQRVGFFQVIDPLSRRALVLYPAEMAMARELDGQRDLFALMDQARVRDLKVSPAKLARFVDVLRDAGFLEDPSQNLGRNEFSLMAPAPLAPESASLSVLAQLEDIPAPTSTSPAREPLSVAAEPALDRMTAQLYSLKLDRSSDRPARRVRVLFVLLAIGMLGAAAVVGIPWARSQVGTTEVRVAEVALVSPAQGSVELSSAGYVVPQTVSIVAAKVSARVARVLVREGQMVRTGDVIAELDSADHRAGIAAGEARARAARARVIEARANLESVMAQVEREHALVERMVSARATLDDLQARARGLRGTVTATAAEAQAVQAEVEALRVSLDQFTIRAPIDGMVIARPVEVGELVGPSLNTITEIADPQSLVVETDVPEGSLERVRPGSPCEIVLDAFSRRPLRGVTIDWAQRVDRSKATLAVRVGFVDRAEGVLPDMAARVSFLAEPVAAGALQQAPRRVLPATAIAQRDGRPVVFVLERDRVRMTAVTLGPAIGTTVEITSSLAPGTRVVDGSPGSLRDGQAVRVKDL